MTQALWIIRTAGAAEPRVPFWEGPESIFRREVARIVTPTLEIAAGVPWTFAQGLEIEFERGSGR